MLTRIKALPWQELVLPLAAVVLALLIGSVFILYVGENPLTAYGILLRNRWQHEEHRHYPAEGDSFDVHRLGGGLCL